MSRAAQDIMAAVNSTLYCAKLQAFFLAAEDVGLPGCVQCICALANIQGKLNALLEAMEARKAQPDYTGESFEDDAERIRTLRIRAKMLLRDYIDSIDREELE